jgi:hypothetical protein
MPSRSSGVPDRDLRSSPVVPRSPEQQRLCDALRALASLRAPASLRRSIRGAVAEHEASVADHGASPSNPAAGRPE